MMSELDGVHQSLRFIGAGDDGKCLSVFTATGIGARHSLFVGDFWSFSKSDDEGRWSRHRSLSFHEGCRSLPELVTRRSHRTMRGELAGHQNLIEFVIVGTGGNEGKLIGTC